MKKTLIVIGICLLFTIITGVIYLDLRSRRYIIIDTNYVLDTWTGNITRQGHFIYNVHKPSGALY